MIVQTSVSGSCYTAGYFTGSAAFDTISIDGFSFTDNSLFVAKIDSTAIVNPVNTGIKNTTTLKGFAVYPNPFNTSATIQFETAVANSQINVQVYDLMGKLVTNKAIVSDVKDMYNKKQITISRGELPDGLYFGKITVGNAIYTSRLMLIK